MCKLRVQGSGISKESGIDVLCAFARQAVTTFGVEPGKSHLHSPSLFLFSVAFALLFDMTPLHSPDISTSIPPYRNLFQYLAYLPRTQVQRLLSSLKLVLALLHPQQGDMDALSTLIWSNGTKSERRLDLRRLPTELLLEIFGQMDPATRACAALVSRDWRC